MKDSSLVLQFQNDEHIPLFSWKPLLVRGPRLMVQSTGWDEEYRVVAVGSERSSINSLWQWIAKLLPSLLLTAHNYFTKLYI